MCYMNPTKTKKYVLFYLKNQIKNNEKRGNMSYFNKISLKNVKIGVLFYHNSIKKQ